MFCIICIAMPIIHASAAAAAAGGAASASYRAEINRLKDNNCIKENLPPMTDCNSVKKIMKCEYNCYKDNGIKTYYIDYNDGSITSNFITYKEIERQREKTKKEALLVVFTILLICIILGGAKLIELNRKGKKEVKNGCRDK